MNAWIYDLYIYVKEKRTYGHELRVTLHHCNMILYTVLYLYLSCLMIALAFSYVHETQRYNVCFYNW